MFVVYCWPYSDRNLMPVEKELFVYSIRSAQCVIPNTELLKKYCKLFLLKLSFNSIYDVFALWKLAFGFIIFFFNLVVKSTFLVDPELYNIQLYFSLMIKSFKK